MRFTLHATRRTPHGASRLEQAMSAWLEKTRRALSRHRKDVRVYGHTTTAKLSTPPPQHAPPPPTVASVTCRTPYERSLQKLSVPYHEYSSPCNSVLLDADGFFEQVHHAVFFVTGTVHGPPHRQSVVRSSVAPVADRRGQNIVIVVNHYCLPTLLRGPKLLTR